MWKAGVQVLSGLLHKTVLQENTAVPSLAPSAAHLASSSAGARAARGTRRLAVIAAHRGGGGHDVLCLAARHTRVRRLVHRVGHGAAGIHHLRSRAGPGGWQETAWGAEHRRGGREAGGWPVVGSAAGQRRHCSWASGRGCDSAAGGGWPAAHLVLVAVSQRVGAGEERVGLGELGSRLLQQQRGPVHGWTHNRWLQVERGAPRCCEC